MKPVLRRGLYVITDPGLGSRLPAAVESAIEGGAVLIQYRDKGDDAARRRQEAAALKEICRRHGVPLIINDDIALAAVVGADGVHLGASDAGMAEARAQLGPDALIGISCYNELARAQEAERQGADYIAFGSFFPSPTKPDAVRTYPELLTAAQRSLSVPVVAIGGITPENGPALVAAGADLLAVITGVFAAPDICAAARRYAALFHSP